MSSIGRADLASLPDYVPGRKIPGVIEAICRAARGVNRYPDTGSDALTSRIAAALAEAYPPCGRVL